MGRTLPTTSDLLNKEKTELGRFRRALRKEDQLVFDELWTYVSKHLMACNQADHVEFQHADYQEAFPPIL